MYERFYGLSEPPFELTANPKYLFLTKTQREALSNLQYGLSSAKSLTLLIGEAGTGKTTLIRAALESERCRHVRCIYLNNPVLRIGRFHPAARPQVRSRPRVRRVQVAPPRAPRAAPSRTARIRRNDRARDRRGPEPQRRTARGDTSSREHRDAFREAPAPAAGWTARARSATRRAEPSAVEAARDASMRAPALRHWRIRPPILRAGFAPLAATLRASSVARPSRSFTSAPAGFRERSA